MNTNAPAVAFALSDLRAETRPLRRSAVIEQLLFDLREKLEAREDGSVRRGLLRKLESLQNAVNRWHALPPSREQASAMLDMLLGLQESSDEGRPSWKE